MASSDTQQIAKTAKLFFKLENKKLYQGTACSENPNNSHFSSNDFIMETPKGLGNHTR